MDETEVRRLTAENAALRADVARLRAEHEAPGEHWYVYDPFDGCHKTFRTADEAKAEAASCIEYARDQDGWPEEVEQVEWGRLIPYESAVATNIVDAKDDDSGRCERDGLDYLCDYELRSARELT